MQKEIHPPYHTLLVTCACGASYETRSALNKDTLHSEVCAACHPFYTGKQKIVDTAGRVEKFNHRFGTAYTQ